MSSTLVQEKLAQATQVLNELDIDLWMIVARESDVLGDPSLPLDRGDERHLGVFLSGDEVW